MADTISTRASRIHARLAWAVFAVPTLVYLATWNIEPYLYAYCVLGLGSVQVLWFLAGVAFAIVRTPPGRWRVALAASAAGAVSAVVSFAYMKSINWA